MSWSTNPLGHNTLHRLFDQDIVLNVLHQSGSEVLDTRDCTAAGADGSANGRHSHASSTDMSST